MTFLARLLAVVLSLPPPYYTPGHEPESAQARAARIETIVTTAVQEAEEARDEWPGAPEELAIALVSVTWFESRRWAIEVHDGRWRGDRGASVCLAQVWSKDRSLVGTSMEATRQCLKRATEILLLHANRCHIRRIDQHQMSRLFTAYGTGKTCRSSRWARPRAAFWSALKRRAEQSTPDLRRAVLSPPGSTLQSGL